MKNIYETIIEQSPISIVITDIDGNITYVNPKFIELTGYQMEEILGKTPRILKSGKVDHEEYEHIWETVLSGKVWKGELINKKKNGELYTEYAVISPIKDDDGNITRLISLKEDITELRHTQDELHQAEKLKGITNMASYISHEIKSPLTSMKINIDMLLRNNSLPESTHKSLQIVQSEISRLFNLLKNILEYSKQEKVSLTQIYLPEFIDTINNIFEPQFEEKGVRFINNIKEHKILGDVQRLESVFILLIENSLEAIGDNGTIEISSASCNGNCSIFIKDNGSGIMDKENIFEPFFTTKKCGTGLGLAIAKEILDKHNGDIKLVSSRPGETIFEIAVKLESQN